MGRQVRIRQLSVPGKRATGALMSKSHSTFQGPECRPCGSLTVMSDGDPRSETQFYNLESMGRICTIVGAAYFENDLR